MVYRASLIFKSRLIPSDQFVGYQIPVQSAVDNSLYFLQTTVKSNWSVDIRIIFSNFGIGIIIVYFHILRILSLIHLFL